MSSVKLEILKQARDMDRHVEYSKKTKDSAKDNINGPSVSLAKGSNNS
ncbi:hypothetical protein [Peribacillus sp. SCS-155]